MPKKSSRPLDDEEAVGIEEATRSTEIVAEKNFQVARQTGVNGASEGANMPADEQAILSGSAAELNELSVEQANNAGAAALSATVIELDALSAAAFADEENAIDTEPIDNGNSFEIDEQPGGRAFPLELEHSIEVTSAEAMEAGWPGMPVAEEPLVSPGMFPLEIQHEQGNILIAYELRAEFEPAMDSEPVEARSVLESVSSFAIFAQAQPLASMDALELPPALEQLPDLAIEQNTASVEFVPRESTPVETEPGEFIGPVELVSADETPFEPEPGAVIGNVGFVPRGATAIQQEPGTVIGAVDLVSRGAASPEAEPGELIGPVELVRFMSEEAAGAAASAGGSEPALVAAIEMAQTGQATERRHVAKSAALVSIGNLGSSLVGMARQVVVTHLGSAVAGPFTAALTPANSFYQLLINGSVSGALVPTFNDYAAPEKREEMRRVVFTVVNLILLLALVASIAYALVAPWTVPLQVPGYDPASQALTLQYSRIIFFSLIMLGPFAVLLSALFALKEFGWPAFATAAYHVGIILGAIGLSFFGSFYWGSIALPIGVLFGALGEIVLLLPGIRRQHFYYMFVLDLKHPALRNIVKLYFPILVSYAFSTALVFVDGALWTRAGGDGAANTVAQSTATTLLQFPVGLVAMALGFAVLPTLTEHAREGNNERFKATLLLGFRVGLLLMIPAMVGMWVLRLPIVDLLFSHRASGNSGLADANLSAIALQNYVYQLPFVAVDQLLIAAFYARKNTLTPVMIGIVCIGFYFLVALPFFQTVGIAALAFANTVQNSMHAIILLILLRRAIGSLHIRQTIPAVLKICVAAAAMGLVAWGTMTLLSYGSLFSLTHLIGQLLTVLIAGSLAVAVYVGAVLLLGVEEINLVKGAILGKLGRR